MKQASLSLALSTYIRTSSNGVTETFFKTTERLKISRLCQGCLRLLVVEWNTVKNNTHDTGSMQDHINATDRYRFHFTWAIITLITVLIKMNTLNFGSSEMH